MGISEKVLGSYQIPTPDAGESEIRVGRGIRSWAAEPVAGCGLMAILTQPSVGATAAELAEAIDEVPVHIRELPDGDAAKTLEVVGNLYEWLNSLGFTRADTVVAVGGGALTDVAGFVAATYLRGVRATYVPTTLLGAVDASIGGKTGVNIGGKNLAGVFSHPARIAVDLDILDRLPEHLLREGAAETVKAGFIAERSIMEAYEREGLGASLEEVVPAAIGVKVRTVTEDFREGGIRAILNYGHTMGHALEVVAGLPHGHAVAIGMVAAGEVSAQRLGFSGAARQRSIIDKLGLPTRSPQVDKERVRRLIDLDKKRDSRGLRMVLLEDFGKPVVVYVIDTEVRSGLAAVGVELD